MFKSNKFNTINKLSWIYRVKNGPDLKIDRNQLADIFFFSLADLYLINQNNKLLMLFSQLK